MKGRCPRPGATLPERRLPLPGACRRQRRAPVCRRAQGGLHRRRRQSLQHPCSNATVAAVDCDSFQVGDGSRFPCLVGTELFVPPELLGKALGAARRTANHDAFGLAVLIFHLLFMGRHPFAGRYLGKGEMPIERRSPRAASPIATTEPHADRAPALHPPTEMVGLAITGLFERAFHADGHKGRRPGPRRGSMPSCTQGGTRPLQGGDVDFHEKPRSNAPGVRSSSQRVPSCSAASSRSPPPPLPIWRPCGRATWPWPSRGRHGRCLVRRIGWAPGAAAGLLAPQPARRSQALAALFVADISGRSTSPSQGEIGGS